MYLPVRHSRVLPRILGWLGIGVLLAFSERWLWTNVWSVTLVVWWAYLILTAALLTQLLIDSWAARWSARSRSVVWVFLLLAVLLLWARPLMVHAGEALLFQERGLLRIVLE